MFQKVISCALSPNTETDDVWVAIKALLAPWTWKNGDQVAVVESWFKNYFNVHTAVTFNSGRSAFFALLKAFGIGKGDEVLVQAFTCVAVPNSVLWAGAKPVFVDIDDSFNLDPQDLEKKITSKTKAIVVQHTFGIPAQIDELVALAQKHNLILIEDCAHSLGATYLSAQAGKGKKIGTLGDAAFFSFGRDKVVSSVWGGAATISKKHKVQSEKLENYQKKIPMPGNFWIFGQLMHPIAFSIILTLYDVIIGKVLLVLLQKLRLLSLPVYKEEKVGGKPNDFPAKYPNALAKLLIHQLAKLDTYNRTRKHTASYYWNSLQSHKGITATTLLGGAMYLRYPILVDKPKEIIAHLKQRGILLGNWYHHVIDPTDVSLKEIGYIGGSCPKAEYIAAHIVNLPTRTLPYQAKRVVDALS